MAATRPPTARKGSALPHARDPFAHYKVLKEIGNKHNQGATFIVECKEDGDTYALRMVECNDECDASKSVDEATELLLPLSHAGLAKLKEVFVHFDREAESWYTCMVQPHYELAALDFVLEQRRSKEECLPETIYKKWLGQAIEALECMHSTEAIHRNIRPSSIFVSDGMDAVLGDVAPALLVRDLAARTRSSAEYLSWQAPEVSRTAAPTAKADVYSLGCVFLDLATSGTDTEEQAMATRMRARNDSAALTDVIRGVRASGHYAKDLAVTLTMMLQHDPSMRASSEDLLSDPYIRSCLKLAKSEILAREAKRAAMAIQVRPTTTKRLPDNVGDLLGFIEVQMKRVGVVVGCFERLCQLALATDSTFELDSEALERIRAAMERWDDNVYAQATGLNLLRAALPKLPPSQADVVRVEFPEVVLAALKMHDHSQMLAQIAFEFIAALCQGKQECAKRFGEAGTIAVLLELWRTGDLTEPASVSSCINALCALTIDPTNSAEIAREQCESNALAELESHSDALEVVQAVGTLLWMLTASEDGFARLVRMGIVARLATLLETHISDATTVAVLAHAMAPLFVSVKVVKEVEVNEEVDVAGIILDALDSHRQVFSTALPLVEALFEMSHHELLHEVLIEADSVETLARLERECVGAHEAELEKLCHRTINLLLQIPELDDDVEAEAEAKADGDLVGDTAVGGAVDGGDVDEKA
mmetsp:Transcript_25097/g.65460  ORF Transcript_25097/g.65460 Transcript_25097/m.65460 type:complete len:708 (+) Transcript_25097:41-2164(+)